MEKSIINVYTLGDYASNIVSKVVKHLEHDDINLKQIRFSNENLLYPEDCFLEAFSGDNTVKKNSKVVIFGTNQTKNSLDCKETFESALSMMFIQSKTKSVTYLPINFGEWEESDIKAYQVDNLCKRIKAFVNTGDETEAFA